MLNSFQHPSTKRPPLRQPFCLGGRGGGGRFVPRGTIKQPHAALFFGKGGTHGVPPISKAL